MRRLNALLVAIAIGASASFAGASEASAAMTTVPAGTGGLASALKLKTANGDNAIVQEASHKKRYKKRYGKRYRNRDGRRYYRHKKHGRRHYRRYRDNDDFNFYLNVNPLWVAPPVVRVVPVYPQAGACSYWAQRCAQNWSRPNDIRGCLRYYGCY